MQYSDRGKSTDFGMHYYSRCFSTSAMSQLSFDHLLNLSFAFHTRRKTGEVLRILDRGAAINHTFEVNIHSIHMLSVSIVTVPDPRSSSCSALFQPSLILLLPWFFSASSLNGRLHWSSSSSCLLMVNDTLSCNIFCRGYHLLVNLC